MLPTLLLFTFHWYVGAVPPLVGDAVNVTQVPEQSKAGASLLIEMAGVTIGIAVTVLLDEEERPQLLPADTLMVPLLLPVVIVMEFEAEVPVQPGGRDQV